jgi:hypothetical protein
METLFRSLYFWRWAWMVSEIEVCTSRVYSKSLDFEINMSEMILPYLINLVKDKKIPLRLKMQRIEGMLV